MARIGLKQLEAPVSQGASLSRQAAIVEPELRGGKVFQGVSGVQ